MLMFDTFADYGNEEAIIQNLKFKLNNLKPKFTEKIMSINNLKEILDENKDTEYELNDNEFEYLIFRLKKLENREYCYNCLNYNFVKANSVYDVDLTFLFNILLDVEVEPFVDEEFKNEVKSQSPVESMFIKNAYFSFAEYTDFYEVNTHEKTHISSSLNKIGSFNPSGIYFCSSLKSYLSERLITFEEFIGNEIILLQNKKIFHLNSLVKLLFKNKIIHKIHKEELDQVVKHFKIEINSPDLNESRTNFLGIICFNNFEDSLNLPKFSEKDKEFYCGFQRYLKVNSIQASVLIFLLQSKIEMYDKSKTLNLLEDNCGNKHLEKISNQNNDPSSNYLDNSIPLQIMTKEEFDEFCLSRKLFNEDIKIPESLLIYKSKNRNDENSLYDSYVNMTLLKEKIETLVLDCNQCNKEANIESFPVLNLELSIENSQIFSFIPKVNPYENLNNISNINNDFIDENDKKNISAEFNFNNNNGDLINNNLEQIDLENERNMNENLNGVDNGTNDAANFTAPNNPEPYISINSFNQVDGGVGVDEVEVDGDNGVLQQENADLSSNQEINYAIQQEHTFKKSYSKQITMMDIPISNNPKNHVNHEITKIKEEKEINLESNEHIFKSDDKNIVVWNKNLSPESLNSINKNCIDGIDNTDTELQKIKNKSSKSNKYIRQNTGDEIAVKAQSQAHNIDKEIERVRCKSFVDELLDTTIVKIQNERRSLINSQSIPIVNEIRESRNYDFISSEPNANKEEKNETFFANQLVEENANDDQIDKKSANANEKETLKTNENAFIQEDQVNEYIYSIDKNQIDSNQGMERSICNSIHNDDQYVNQEIFHNNQNQNLYQENILTERSKKSIKSKLSIKENDFQNPNQLNTPKESNNQNDLIQNQIDYPKESHRSRLSNFSKKTNTTKKSKVLENENNNVNVIDISMDEREKLKLRSTSVDFTNGILSKVSKKENDGLSSFKETKKSIDMKPVYSKVKKVANSIKNKENIKKPVTSNIPNKNPQNSNEEASTNSLNNNNNDQQLD